MGDDSTAKIFDQSMPHLLRALVEGINVSVFAFGSTNSGKTHTI